MDSTTAMALFAELPTEACEEVKSSPPTSIRCIPETLALCHPSITLDDTSPLKTRIPNEHFPDDLIVHGNVVSASQSTVRYSRVYPMFPRDTTGFPHGKRGCMRKYFPSTPRNVAHLHLTSAVTLGSGMQTSVLRAPLSLPHPSKDGSLVSVVVKLAHHLCGAHQRVMMEAELFNTVSSLLEEDPVGSRLPRCSEDDESTYDAGNGEIIRIPKFYGFYLPVRKDGSIRFRAHDEGCDEECIREVSWMTPIILWEESEETVVAE